MMTNHKWEMVTNGRIGAGDGYRAYKCSRCGSGPIYKSIFDGKDSITKGKLV